MEGGADTTAMFLQFFILCMMANPDVKVKAQQEIDEVIGHHRSPELEDINDLPYVRAVVNEVGIQTTSNHTRSRTYLGTSLSSGCSYINPSRSFS